MLREDLFFIYKSSLFILVPLPQERPTQTWPIRQLQFSDQNDVVRHGHVTQNSEVLTPAILLGQLRNEC